MARKRVVELETATATLSKNQSGALIVLNRAAGIVVTLPTASRGLVYDFVVKTSVTSNLYSIDAAAANTLLGFVYQSEDATASGQIFVPNGTTHRSIDMNGTTTGGLVGTTIRFVADNNGFWFVSGFNRASGTLANPFAA